MLPIPDVDEEDLLELADQDIEEEEDLLELPEPEPEEEDILELGPEMQVEPAPMDNSDLIGSASMAASTAALSELSRAIARDRGVGVGRAGVTLEDIVRDSLKPLLREWLDQNLPYLIERLVKAEIEKMVNRAERG